MSWQLVKDAFFVEKDGRCQYIDIAVCTSCSSIHFSVDEANACHGREIPTYEELKLRFKMLDDFLAR